MRIQTLVASVALCIPMLASSAPIYSVNRTIGAGSVVGTIETDGTLGTLGTSNVLDWSLTINDGTAGDFLLTNANSVLSISGSLLSATATGLVFDFSGFNGFVLFQNPHIGSTINFWCMEGVGPICTGIGDGTESVRRTSTVFTTHQSAVQVGTLQANVVPEPATLALVLAAAGIAVGVRRRTH